MLYSLFLSKKPDLPEKNQTLTRLSTRLYVYIYTLNQTNQTFITPYAIKNKKVYKRIYKYLYIKRVVEKVR